MPRQLLPIIAVSEALQLGRPGVVALARTIEIMAQIDEAIEAHGSVRDTFAAPE